MVVEIWKDILDWEGYYKISNKGRLKSLDRIVNYSDGRVRLFKGKIISSSRLDTKGYVNLTLCKGILKKQCRVHVLVGNTFIPNPLNKKFLNHKNGKRTDNRIKNLEWCTKAENTADGIKRGTIKNYMIKLTKKQIIKIRKLYETGNYGQFELAKKFKVAQSHISRITRKNCWNNMHLKFNSLQK